MAHPEGQKSNLETQRGFGVAVIDVSAAADAATLARLERIEGTLRVFTVLSCVV